MVEDLELYTKQQSTYDTKNWATHKFALATNYDSLTNPKYTTNKNIPPTKKYTTNDNKLPTTISVSEENFSMADWIKSVPVHFKG